MSTLKKWLGKRGTRKREERAPDADDFLAAGRFEEAESLLRTRLAAHPDDRHARLKLADLLMRTGRRPQAVDEYIAAAERFARDGFHDKALALLAKVARLLPTSEKIPAMIERLEREKRLDHRRHAVIEALTRRPGGRGRALSVVEAQAAWSGLVDCHLVERLDEEQLRKLFDAFEVVRVGEGDRVAAAGEELERIFVVASGAIEVVLDLEGQGHTVLRSLEQGDLFGERALLEHRPWPAAYRAGKPSLLLRLDREGLERALVGNPDPRALLQALRERRLDAAVADTVGKLK